MQNDGVTWCVCFWHVADLTLRLFIARLFATACHDQSATSVSISQVAWAPCLGVTSSPDQKMDKQTRQEELDMARGHLSSYRHQWLTWLMTRFRNQLYQSHADEQGMLNTRWAIEGIVRLSSSQASKLMSEPGSQHVEEPVSLPADCIHGAAFRII